MKVLRTLSVNNSNYAAMSSMTVKWRAGAFERQGSIASLDELPLENRVPGPPTPVQIGKASPRRYSPPRPIAGGVTTRQFEGASPFEDVNAIGNVAAYVAGAGSDNRAHFGHSRCSAPRIPQGKSSG